MTARLHCTPQSKTAKPRVGPCEGFCAYPAGRMASVYLRGTETQCWGLCARLWRETVFSKIRTAKQKADMGRLGSSPSLPAVLFATSQRIFWKGCVWQNAQGKRQPRCSILKQDKAVVSPHFTPARSAGRKCRGQKTFGLFTVCFEKFDMISLSIAWYIVWHQNCRNAYCFNEFCDITCAITAKIF